MAKVARLPLRIGAWIVYPDLNTIQGDGGSKQLQPRSMDVLVYLADRAATVVSNDELLADVWHGRLFGDDTVHRRIADLRRQLEDEARRPSYIQTVPKRGYRLIAPVEEYVVPGEVSAATRKPPARRARLLAITGWATGALIVALALAVAVLAQRDAGAVNAAIAEAERWLGEDRYQAAFDAVQPWIHRSDPRIQTLLRSITLPASIRTNPAGVPVAYRRHGADPATWIELGPSPIVDLTLPRGAYKLKLDERVLMNVTHPGVTLNSAGVAERVVALPDGELPPDMTFVPSGRYQFGAWGFLEAHDLGGFLIDRTEVTNAEFQIFVEAGGYQDPRYWQPLIDRSAGALTWNVLETGFVDRTGRPGPAGWEHGSYPPGAATLPVTGISWYEAEAFLASRGKTLPTVHHWLRAALGPMEWKYPYAPALVPHSNLSGRELLAVGGRPGNEVHGAYDLIGNAREWTASVSGHARVTMGGSFREPAWSYNFPTGTDPLQRADDLGFRGMRRTAQSLADPDPRIELFNDLRAPIRRVSDAVFEGMTYQYAYHPGTLSEVDVTELGETAFEQWTLRKLLIATERPDDPMPVLMFLPRRPVGRLQSVVFLPPADSWSPGFRSDSIRLESYQLDFLPRSGRALIWPVLTGSHERYDGIHGLSGKARAALAIERGRRIRNELGRLLDHLAQDPDFDGDRVALAGLSHGALVAAQALALERRFRAALLFSVGIAPPNPIFANPQNDPNLYWARVAQPTLIVNGRFDPIRPHQHIIEPLLALLATPAEDKRAVLLDGAHWPLPRSQMVAVSHAWLDRYLGPVPMLSASLD